MASRVGGSESKMEESRMLTEGTENENDQVVKNDHAIWKYLSVRSALMAAAFLVALVAAAIFVAGQLRKPIYPELTPAGWLAEGLKYHESPALSKEAKAYLDGTAPPASEWPDVQDWMGTLVAAMEKLPPGVSTDDHDGTPIGEGESIGLLAAEMHMDHEQLQLLPEAFQTGLFSPCEADCLPWPAALRFSHTVVGGEDLMRAALKIGGVAGREVDLLFTETLKSFVMADRDALEAFIYSSKYGIVQAAAKYPVTMGKSAVSVKTTLGKYSKIIKSFGVLGKDYHSLTPYLIGGHGNTSGAMKFRMVPIGDRASYPSVPEGGSVKAAMRQQLVETMVSASVSWHFEIQVATDPKSHPIDADTTEWNEDNAPWVRMGTLLAPTQEFEQPVTVGNVVGSGLWQGGHHAAFNSKEFAFMPGRSPHSPLGAVGAFRAALYPVYDRARQEHLLGKEGGSPAVCPFANISEWLGRSDDIVNISER